MIYDDHATQQTGFGMAIGILFASFVVSTCSYRRSPPRRQASMVAKHARA